MTDDPLTTCPKCAGAIRRVLFPAGVVFKGGGFYSTDNRPTQALTDAGKGDQPATSDKAGAGKSDQPASGDKAAASTNTSATKSDGGAPSASDKPAAAAS